MTLHVRQYNDALQMAWDDFVGASKNATFLFLRAYMDYHSDRFADCSLLIMDDDEIVAVLPANRVGDAVHSHQGLTFGGLVTSRAMTTPIMLDVFAALQHGLRGMGVKTLFYKTIPAIYHHVPAEEDLYALFLANAEIYRRDVLCVISAAERLPPQQRRRRGAAKAARQGIVVGRSDDWTGYWALLASHIRERFGVDPVHSLQEIELLRSLFPKNIHLHLAHSAAEILAGVVIYESASVAHVQYIASSDRGRNEGALDLLFMHLIDEAYAAKRFFDFGISNEQNGRVLNRGLIEQKEGFGGRAVVHDFYRLSL